MAKNQSNTPVETLTNAQKKTATAFFLENAAATAKGAPKWASIRAMFVVGGIEITSVKQELAALNRQTWIDKARADKGSELTLEEIDRIKKTANADFSRGVRDPNAKPKPRKPQQPAADADGDEEAQKPAKSGAGATQAPPSVVATIEQAVKRCKALQTEMVAFQNHCIGAHVTLPSLALDSIGVANEELTKMLDELNAALASMA